MDLGYHIKPGIFVACKLWYLQQVVRLGAGLLGRIINKHRVKLAPLHPILGLRVAGRHLGIIPQSRETLVAPDALVEILVREAKVLARPDEQEPPAVPGFPQQAVYHCRDVEVASRRPDHNGELGVEKVLQECGGVVTRKEVAGPLPVWTVEEGAVEVEDDEELAPLLERLRLLLGQRKVGRRGFGDAT